MKPELPSEPNASKIKVSLKKKENYPFALKKFDVLDRRGLFNNYSPQYQNKVFVLAKLAAIKVIKENCRSFRTNEAYDYLQNLKEAIFRLKIELVAKCNLQGVSLEATNYFENQFKDFFDLIEIESESLKIINKKVEKLNKLTAPIINHYKPQKTDTDNLKEKIEKNFKFLLEKNLRNHKVMLNEEDYKKWIERLIYFYQSDFSLKNKKYLGLNLNCNKGDITKANAELFDELFPGTVSRPENLHLLLKYTFKKFEGNNVEQIKKFIKEQNSLNWIRKIYK